jgi:heme/copper-type cytochrome/quinol oxidase subunit 2
MKAAYLIIGIVLITLIFFIISYSDHSHEHTENQSEHHHIDHEDVLHQDEHNEQI